MSPGRHRAALLKVVGIAALALAGPVALAAYGNSGSSGPITIGAVTALTGPIPIPDGTNGAKAYFDALNARGGIHGHKINYIVEDDQSNPQLAGQDARTLVTGDNVVAMAGVLSGQLRVALVVLDDVV